MRKMKQNMNWKPLSVLVASLVLTACGGGGGGGSDAVAPAGGTNSPTTPTTPSTPASTVTGAITKGPVSGATINLFEMDAFGNPIGQSIATGTSGDDGSFQVAIDSSTDLLLIASGGSFLDESDQETDVSLKRRIQLGTDDTFLSVLPAGQDTVAVTPITTALVLRGRVLGGPDGTFAAKFASAKADFDAQAGFDVLATIPANPVAPEANATEAQKQYALLLGGIANLINNVAIQSGAAAPTYDMVVAVTFDLVDGQFDGQYFGQTDVPGSGASPVQLPQNLNFSEEINRFRNNNFASFSNTVVPSIEVSTFANNLPTANAGVDASVSQATPAQLDGSASSDPDSGLFYSWVQTAGTTVTLSDAAAASPTFTAPARLIANETLTFELTVIDTVGFTSVDTVNVEVVGALPSDFYVVDEDEVGDGIGIDVDGGGRITLTDATNGVLKTDLGPVPFTYTVAGNDLTINFPTPFLQDDYDEERDPDGDGVTEFLLVEERIDQFIFSLVTDNSNRDELTIRSIGNEVVLPLDMPDATPLATNPLDDSDPITAFDVAQAIPFANLAGTRRTLWFNTLDVDAAGTLENDDELYVEIFDFIDGTTGTTVDSNVSFTYSIAADGSLDVTFANGETAKYINLGSRPSGDIIATEYVLNQPFFPDDSTQIADVSLSIARNAAAPTPSNLLEAAGVYSGVFYDDDIETGANLNVKLNPDGTGSVTFDSPANRSQFFDFNDVFAFRSGLGVCWGLDADGDIVIDRARSLNVSFPNSFSSETDTSFCAGLDEDTTDLRFELTQLDSDGTTYKYFTRLSRNRCAFTTAADCAEQPVLDLRGFELRIVTRVPLTATPPVAALDPVQTQDATAVTIDLVSNDIQRDNPIDPGSVQLGRGPFQGTITSFDQATGVLVYTPNPGIRSDLIEYTVADTLGNRSQIQITQIDINPCPLVDGQQAFYDVFTFDCDYSGIGSPANPVLTDVSFGPLPRGGVHKFNDSFVIGDDYNTDADLAGAGIAQGGDGPTLNIAAGTVFAFTNPNSVVAINRGSQINVGGTPTEPVVMTSFSDIQSKRDQERGFDPFQAYNDVGQWGGLMIQGFGVTNACTYSGSVVGGDLAVSGECHILNETGFSNYGGDNNADSSGAINYLQVKYAGAFVGAEEVNAVGLFGVGDGTVISNLQVYSTLDDGIELMGGAVDLLNVAVLYARDDSIGIYDGYSGSISSALLIQDRFSGNLCLEAEGIFDFDNLVSTDIEARITQGINSKFSISNMTCVASGAPSIDVGAGLLLNKGAFASITDSLVTIPGEDDVANNHCIRIDDRSLQAAQDGDVALSAIAFACADRTGGGILPNSTPTESFLISAGNQFASITPGIPNPPPTASAGAGQNLLEGGPLIYSVAPASAQIDGSPVVITPSTFFGAVQLSNDWTQDWTFGLHPGFRAEPLWYEVPIVFAPRFIPASKGQVVTLDASQTISSAGSAGLSFQWTQIDPGETLVLSNPNSATTTFTAPGAGTNVTQEGGFFTLELLVTDANGLETREFIDVNVEASIPEDFYAATEYIIPFQFNRRVGSGPRITLDLSNNTGTYLGSNGSTPFTWTDSPTDFTMDFTGSGGLNFGPFTSFEDVDGDPNNGQEEVQRTSRTDFLTYTLLSDNGPKKEFSVTETGVDTIFDVTNNVALPDETFNNDLSANEKKGVVSVKNGIFIELTGGELQVALTNAVTNFPRLFNPDSLLPDKLSFNSDGTGFALLKNQTFTWFIDNSFGSTLIVDFADGEHAEYTVLFNTDLGDAIGVTYTRFDNTVVADIDGSKEDNPLTTFSSQPFIPGIYETNEPIELDNGTFVNSKLFYRIHPDGRGQLEIELIDPATGNLDQILASGNGICWQLENVNNLVWYRTQAPDQEFTGSVIPGLSHCSLLNTSIPDNTLINFQRDISLLDINSNGQLLTFTENRNNETTIDQAGDPNVVVFTDAFLRNFEPVVSFDGNPPLAVPDAIVVSPSILSVDNVVSNDIQGDGTIDPLTVTIVIPPRQGVASVDPSTGDIQFTPDASFIGPDTLQYRVRDINGNESTIGTVTYLSP